jgi:peroxiredoxin
MPGINSNENTSAPQVGFKAPEIALLNSVGEEVKLSHLEGQVVMVNFWASWCPPCLREMPTMQKVYSEYHEQGFEILAVNTTFQDQRSEADLFVEDNHLSYPILYDVAGDISRAYNLYSTPMSFFIDADGVIRNIIPGGPISEASLISNIESLLQEGK